MDILKLHSVTDNTLIIIPFKRVMSVCKSAKAKYDKVTLVETEGEYEFEVTESVEQIASMLEGKTPQSRKDS